MKAKYALPFSSFRAEFSACPVSQVARCSSVKPILFDIAMSSQASAEPWCRCQLDSAMSNAKELSLMCTEGRVGGCLWRDGFTLDEVIRPPFVSPALAETLLRAGKSLNFLRECCGDTSFEQSLAASPLAAAAAQLSHGKASSPLTCYTAYTVVAIECMHASPGTDLAASRQGPELSAKVLWRHQL